MRKYLFPFLSLFVPCIIFSQKCIVNVDSLKGQYTGDCKNGVAEGMGTATGTDTYNGHFKNGYPDGEGKYTWKNGTWYNGSWKNGLFDGNGTYFKVEQNKPDSGTLLTGFWQAGKYEGKTQKINSFTALTNGVSDISSRKQNNIPPEITIDVKGQTGGGTSLGMALLPNPKLISIDLLQGRFELQTNNETAIISNKYILRKVTFPFSAILSFETKGINAPMPLEKIKVEITESSSWLIKVTIEN